MASGLQNIETVESPFRKFVTTIGVFPTAFTDAMTYYECLAYLVQYMENTMIPAINENAEAVEELQEKYIELKTYVDTYFDNLDVQDEINNKLDEMVEDGTLQELINNVLQPNVQWTFDTVADMQASENLVDGGYAKTLGFGVIGDGGGAIYKISDNGTADNVFVFECGDLYATAINGGVKHISLAQLPSLTEGVYTLGEVDVTSAITLTAQNNRNITIVGTKFNIKTPVMMPAINSGYWIMPRFVGCEFKNGTSDNSRVLITSGGTNTVGTAFTSCSFINVDMITGNNFVQDMNFTDCYIQSHTCFIDEHDKKVQARFVRCNVESDSNKIILAKDGLFYFSGTYEGNVTKNFHYIDIEDHATITLDNCWLESTKFLNLVGSTSATGSSDSIINIIGCYISGYSNSTPQIYITNGSHVDMYISGSTFQAYDLNSRFCNLGYSDFHKIVGEFSTAYSYGKPFGELVGNYAIASLHDIANAENKYFISQKITLNAQAIADGGVNVTLPVGNYLMIVGASSYSVFSGLNTTTVALIGGSPESNTYTNMIELHTGSSMTPYTFTLSKANASDTTFNLNIQRTSAATAWLSLIKL